MEKSSGEEYEVLRIRSHEKSLRMERDDATTDIDRSEINKLLILADYLVSDFSDIIMSYSILERPIICFDENYDRENGFEERLYFDLGNEIPSGVCGTEEEVLSYIASSDYRTECEKVREFMKTHIESAGHAAEICSIEIINNTGI